MRAATIIISLFAATLSVSAAPLMKRENEDMYSYVARADPMVVYRREPSMSIYERSPEPMPEPEAYPSEDISEREFEGELESREPSADNFTVVKRNGRRDFERTIRSRIDKRNYDSSWYSW
ncbi:hypothetical protein C8Q75DRAFT_811271 [Abortiporus biennis]|nr:hypothetical protein C8Q75DRAFT_811271 [Abortiporus biennis]